MKLSAKLNLSLGALLGAGLLITGVGVDTQKRIVGDLDEAVNRTAKKLDLVNAMRARAWEAEAYVRGAFIAAQFGDKAQADKYQQSWKKAVGRLHEQFQEVEPLLVSEAGKLAMSKMKSEVDRYEPLVGRFFVALNAKQNQELPELAAEIATVVTQFDSTGRDLIAQQRAFLEQSKLSAAVAAKRAIWISMGLVALVIAIAVFAWLVVRGAVRTLEHSAADLAEGSRQVALAAGQISQASQKLSEASCQQAASLEESSASTQEINSMTARNAESSKAAAQRASEASGRVETARYHVAELSTSIDGIVQSSAEISRIIQVIDGIAFQTNLLALNAAVEAARAGASGMGFAVVADEVRTLSQRSAQAAKDTSELIEQAVKRSQEGRERLLSVVEAMGGITQDSAAVKNLAEQVSSGSEEQSRGISQMATALQQMESGTQMVAASAQETAASGAELTAQAQGVEQIVQQLTKLVNG